MKEYSTAINGFEVEAMDFGDSSETYIYHGEHSCSLTCLEQTGCMIDGDATIDVPEPIINQIREWAIANDHY